MFMSPIQAVFLWDELLTSFFKKNSYGGDTAEIYIFTMMNGHSVHHANNPDGEWAREDQEIACRNVYQVCKEFIKRHPCRILLLEAPNNDIEHLNDHVYGQRIHLQVVSV